MRTIVAFQHRDINARFRKLSNIFPRGYTENPDNTINEYGKEITEFIFQQTSCKPINHLCKHKLKGEGGFTFHRGDARSQVDWALANKHAIELIEEFKLVENIPKISDHQPISLQIVIDDKPTISVTLSSAFQLNEIRTITRNYQGLMKKIQM